MEPKFPESVIRVEIWIILSGFIPFIRNVISNIAGSEFEKWIACRKEARIHEGGIGWIADICAKNRYCCE